MVENIMYFAIGFLIASLFNLFLVPLVHNRAVRLTIRRLEATTPFSMAEIQAEKDQLRAEYAMATRRLEMSVEQLKAKTTSQLGELGKQAMVIEKLKTELNEKSAAQEAIESRENETRDQLQTVEAKHSEIEQALAGKESDLGKISAALSEHAAISDKQRLEIASLKTQIEQLRAELDVNAARAKEDREAAEVASRELAKEHAKVTNASARIAQLERQLSAMMTEADLRAKRVLELEGRLTEPGRLLKEGESAVRQARTEAEKLQTFAKERANLAQERSQAQEETIASSANERVENALLRERINDIAAEVARLTAALEGPGSPIEAMLAQDNASAVTGSVNGTRDAHGDAAAAPHGDLVERIRALKSRVSRLNPRS